MKLKTLNPIKIFLEGEDKEELLQSIISNDLSKYNSNFYSYILTPQGKILFEIQVILKNNFIEIICTNDQADLFSFLNKFVKLSEVQVKKIHIEQSHYNFEYFTESLKKGRIDTNFIEHSTLLPSEVHDEYIDYNKGCFIGQEVVSRIKHRNLKKKKVLIFNKNSDFKIERIDNSQIILDINSFVILRIPTVTNIFELEKNYKLTKI